MTSKDATPLLAKRLRQTPKFFIEVPLGNRRNELEIVRGATRDIDHPNYSKSPKIGMLGATICVLIILFSAWGISRILGF